MTKKEIIRKALATMNAGELNYAASSFKHISIEEIEKEENSVEILYLLAEIEFEEGAFSNAKIYLDKIYEKLIPESQIRPVKTWVTVDYKTEKQKKNYTRTIFEGLENALKPDRHIPTGETKHEEVAPFNYSYYIQHLKHQYFRTIIFYGEKKFKAGDKSFELLKSIIEKYSEQISSKNQKPHRELIRKYWENISLIRMKQRVMTDSQELSIDPKLFESLSEKKLSELYQILGKFVSKQIRKEFIDSDNTLLLLTSKSKILLPPPIQETDNNEDESFGKRLWKSFTKNLYNSLCDRNENKEAIITAQLTGLGIDGWMAMVVREIIVKIGLGTLCDMWKPKK